MSEKKKVEKITAVKGMNDILPADAPLWELFENTVQSILKSYGFQKIVTPIVEDTALFKRAIGAVTDIVIEPGEARGEVQGSRYEPYLATIFVAPAGDGEGLLGLIPERAELLATCSCPDAETFGVCKHALAVLLVLAVPFAGIRLGQPGAAVLPADESPRLATERLAAEFGAGVTGPMEILVDTPGGAGAASPAGARLTSP